MLRLFIELREDGDRLIEGEIHPVDGLVEGLAALHRAVDAVIPGPGDPDFGRWWNHSQHSSTMQAGCHLCVMEAFGL